jgi:hypothetical protein
LPLRMSDKGSGRLLKLWLATTGIVYAAGAIDFVLRPGAATQTLGAAANERLDDEEPGLYNALASAYMATIASLALAASKDPEGRSELIPPLMVAKAVSSSALLFRYQMTRRKGYAYGAALDASILGITAGLYSRLKNT